MGSINFNYSMNDNIHRKRNLRQCFLRTPTQGKKFYDASFMCRLPNRQVDFGTNMSIFICIKRQVYAMNRERTKLGEERGPCVVSRQVPLVRK